MMSRVATTLVAALSLWASNSPPMGWLTPAVLIGIDVLSVRVPMRSNCGLVRFRPRKSKRGDLQGAIADWTKAIEMYPQ